MTEPPRHQPQDAFALPPAIVSAGLLVAVVAAGFVNLAVDDETASKVIAAVMVGTWLLGLAAGLYAMGAASSQIAMLRAEGRTIALPATALALAIVVCGVGSTPIALFGLILALAHDHPDHAADATLRAYSVPLTAPWASMSVPVQCGDVLYSDSTTVTVMYDRGAIGDHVHAYDAAISGRWLGGSAGDLDTRQAHGNLHSRHLHP